MKYEIEIINKGEYLTNLTFGDVVSTLAEMGENNTENIKTIKALDTWESALFGECLVTRCSEEEQSIGGENMMGMDKETILDQITVAFWSAMEENEREFQAYLATNPLPFEKFRAVREHYSTRRINEQKYMHAIAHIEGDNELMEQLHSIFGGGEDSDLTNSHIFSQSKESTNVSDDEDDDDDWDWI